MILVVNFRTVKLVKFQLVRKKIDKKEYQFKRINPG